MQTKTATTEYHKIDTLFDRDEATHKVIHGAYRRPEFALVSEWDVYEKIDGTNVRVMFSGVDGTIRFGGRTDNAQMPVRLLTCLNALFTVDKMKAAFAGDEDPIADVVLYGEGYGATIQKGGGNYRSDVSFRLFDVKVGDWWLEREDIDDVAANLGIKTAPYLGVHRTQEAIDMVVNMSSCVAGEEGVPGTIAEGIVARSPITLINRKGYRLMWKLKHRDF